MCLASLLCERVRRRAGADWATAVEVSGHMADAASEALVANGFAGRSAVIARDVRRVHAEPLGDRLADLNARADLLIFEVRSRLQYRRCGSSVGGTAAAPVAALSSCLDRSNAHAAVTDALRRAGPRGLKAGPAHAVRHARVAHAWQTLHVRRTPRPSAQVFDSGLLGEGVLHLLAWARARLAAPDATLARRPLRRPREAVHKPAYKPAAAWLPYTGDWFGELVAFERCQACGSRTP